MPFVTHGLSANFWGDDTQKRFMNEQASRLARDADGNLVYLATSIYNLQTTQKHWPEVQFHTTREKNQTFE